MRNPQFVQAQTAYTHRFLKSTQITFIHTNKEKSRFTQKMSSFEGKIAEKQVQRTFLEMRNNFTLYRSLSFLQETLRRLSAFKRQLDRI